MTVAEPVLFRPFRHRCGEADLRDAMTDEDFWQHVYGRDGWAPDDGWDDGPGDPLESVTNPCPECGQHGACDYDAEGRALVHVTDVDRG